MSVYKVIEVVGTSPTSWEEAARTAIETAGASLRDLRVAEITKLDIRLDDDEIIEYRARVMISFKYDSAEELLVVSCQLSVDSRNYQLTTDNSLS